MSLGLARGKALDVDGVGIEMRSLPTPDVGLIDPRSWFEDPSKSLEIEIGSGKGTFLLQEAKQHPPLLSGEGLGPEPRDTEDTLPHLYPNRDGIRKCQLVPLDITNSQETPRKSSE